MSEPSHKTVDLTARERMLRKNLTPKENEFYGILLKSYPNFAIFDEKTMGRPASCIAAIRRKAKPFGESIVLYRGRGYVLCRSMEDEQKIAEYWRGGFGYIHIVPPRKRLTDQRRARKDRPDAATTEAAAPRSEESGNPGNLGEPGRDRLPYSGDTQGTRSAAVGDPAAWRDKVRALPTGSDSASGDHQGSQDGAAPGSDPVGVGSLRSGGQSVVHMHRVPRS